MSISKDKWFEVWFIEGVDVVPSYLLVVAPDENNPGNVAVYDPQENYKIVHQGQDYESTRLWLREDEFNLIKGREFPDDGW